MRTISKSSLICGLCLICLIAVFGATVRIPAFVKVKNAQRLQAALRKLSIEAGRPVRITIQEPQKSSSSLFSKSAIYALMEPGADEPELLHEVLHSVLVIGG